MASTVPGTRQPYKSVAFPADGAAKYIRVLKLDDAAEDVHLTGTLEVVKPDRTGPRFSALSYVWGGYRPAAHTITCNGRNLPITENCYNALRALRGLHMGLRIWVDAICIDQKNVKEKEKQIPQMPDIYKNASTVYIWLGQGNFLFDQTLKVMKMASNLKKTAKKYDAMAAPIITVLLVYASRWKDQLCLRRSIRELEEMAETSGTSIEKLDLDCEWLHRAWTMQEIMFATDPAFLYGKTEVSWEEMRGVSYFTDSKTEKGSHASSLKFAFGDRTCVTWMTFIQSWTDIMSQWSNRTILSNSILGTNTRKKFIKVVGIETMRDLRTRRTSNKHDHVYALHGILKEAYEQAPPDPDYSRPLDLVYEEFIIYLFSLDHIYLNLLTDSGIHQALPDAPSWLPDWSTPFEKRTRLNHGKLEVANWASIMDKLDGFADEPMRTSDEDTEILCAVHNRTLKVSATFHAHPIFCGTLDEEASSAMFGAPHAIQSEHTSESDIPESLLSQLSALTLLYKWFKIGCSHEGFKKNRGSILFTLKGVGYAGEETKIASQTLEPLVVFTLMSNILSAIVKSGAAPHPNEAQSRLLELLLEAENNSDIVDLLNRFAGSMRHIRSIFITEDGATGSGPPEMIAGDRIAFISGVYTPMALRPHGATSRSKSHYTVVGPVVFCAQDEGPVKANWSMRETIYLI